MAFRRQRKYAQSTSPSRQSNVDDPQPRRENNDFGFLIDALTRRILESGLMDNKFLKNFFLSKDDQKKDNEEQRNIIEKRLSQSIRFSRKPQNQGILRVIQEYAREKGIPFEEQIRYQQYDILEKPIILQPTIHVTKDKEWSDIFEKFKSENLKIDPNQNLSELKKIINNNQLTTCQKLQLILRQRFTIHDASNFPDPNPSIGNKEKDGNIVFMVDEQQIPHRIFFRNREEYEIIDWLLERTNRQNLNVITVDWSKYINNVKKIRGDQVVEKRKMIKIRNQGMQIEKLEQSQFEIIQSNQEQQQEDQQISYQKPTIQIQENRQKKPIQLKLKNQFGQQMDKQIREELEMQMKLQKQYYIDDQMMEDLKQILAFDINAGIQLQQNETQINNDDYIRIQEQLPREIRPEKITKLHKNKKLEEEIMNGRLYLNQEQLTQLDNEISKYLQQIRFIERQIEFKGKIYTLASPFYIIGDFYPVMMTRQWWYYKNKDYVQQYIIHSQVLWYLYSQFQIKNPSKVSTLNQVIAIQMEEYQNRWIQILQNDGQTNWFETTESSLILAATENMNESIKQQYDTEQSNYVLELKENIWFTNSSINLLCYQHRSSRITKDLVIYVKFQGYCYYTNMTPEQIVQNMFLFGISFLNSPSFEVVDSNVIICWLCGKACKNWSQLYTHECKQSQKLMKVEDILQSWNL